MRHESASRPLFLKRIRKGTLRLRERGAGVSQSVQAAAKAAAPVCALIQGCSARIKGGEVGALSLHAGLSRSQSGFALLKGGREGRSGLAGAREGIRQAVEAGALLREGRLDLCDLRAESL